MSRGIRGRARRSCWDLAGVDERSRGSSGRRKRIQLGRLSFALFLVVFLGLSLAHCSFNVKCVSGQVQDTDKLEDRSGWDGVGGGAGGEGERNSISGRQETGGEDESRGGREGSSDGGREVRGDLPGQESNPGSDPSSDSGSSSTSAADSDACQGRRIYRYDLPAKFNFQLMLRRSDYDPRNQDEFSKHMLFVLERMVHHGGFGKRMPALFRIRPSTNGSPAAASIADSWYHTDQFALEIIFFSRMLGYDCLVTDYRDADLIYVPYFGGLDMARHMHKENRLKELLARQLVQWLLAQPAWQRLQGRDHFWVLGRETWDFKKNPDGFWGNNLLNLEGVKGVVMSVTSEGNRWDPRDYSAPKPTGFHPVGRAELDAWLRVVQRHHRKYLFSFVGGHRKDVNAGAGLRDNIFRQCNASDRCRLLDCNDDRKFGLKYWIPVCENPRNFISLYLKSTFCIHPRGDACSRRSVLDSMVAGCIPVVFSKCTLQEQFLWHLHGVKGDRENSQMDVGRSDFYVYLPEEDVWPNRGKEGDRGVVMDLESVLSAIPQKRVEEMRRKVLELVPRITYGGMPVNGSIARPDFKDAFDIIVEGLANVRAQEEQ